MKKITLKILILMMFVGTGYTSISQTLNQAANWPNAGWVLSGTYNIDGLLSDPTVASASFTWDDDEAGSGSEDDIQVTSPVIDLTAANAAGEVWITVSGDYVYRAFGGDVLAIETYDADAMTWTALEIFSGNSNSSNYKTCVGIESYVTPILDISGFTPTQLAGFQYRISYDDQGGYNWGWCLTSPTITSAIPASCLEPSVITATSVFETSVNLGWIENGSATVWDVELLASGVPATGIPTATGVTNPYVATGLTADTAYDFYVRADCGGPDTSNWVGPFTFSTACAAISSPYTEDFETFTTAVTPFVAENCWTSTGGAYFWKSAFPTDSGSSGTGPNPTITTGNYFYIEASAGVSGDITDLVSPLVDLTTLTAPSLTFNYHMYGEDIGTLDVLVNGTASVWSLSGQQQTSDTAPFELAVIDLAAYAGQSINITFRGTSAGTFLGDIALDNVSFIELPACPAPISLTTTAITDTTAFLGWTENGSATLWEVEVVDITAGGAATGIPSAVGVSNPYTVTGLTSNNDYAFYVRSDCGGGTLSDWAGPFNFSTLELCPTPSALTATNITETSADLGWTENGAASSWSIELVDITAGGVVTGTATATGVSNPYTATGLIGEHSYEFYVQVDCGVDGVSAWAGPFAFTTPYIAVAPDCTSGIFLDSGGQIGEYSNGETITYTICPDNPGDIVNVEFTFFSTENNGAAGCLDGLTIYDGPDDSSATINPDGGGTIWCWDRNDSPALGTGDLQGMIITSTDASGCLTFVFTSDASVTRPGWEAIVSCTSACTADAGTLTADESSVFLAGGTATISASEATVPTVPTGYMTSYVLTSGAGLLIEQVGVAASFDVTATGDYTIHTLVYDPNTLDLGTLPTDATGFDVDALLLQGGGTICGSLDVTGAAITVEDCTADAGTLTADASSVFLVGGTATISASEATAPTVPAGYTSLYVLTSGAGLVIEQTDAASSFDVTATGDYTIHTLVYDPNTLDLGTLPTDATGFDVDALLIQGGGAICGALDVAGAAVTVEDCIADAGTLTADESSVFLAGGTATISVSEATAPTVPAGYTSLYVLTAGAGLVIEQTDAAASFDVTATGDYTIHTLVYDPNTLDLGTLPTDATGFDVNALLIQGGGAICGALDVAGAAITVEDCTADAGTLTADASPVFLSGGAATISASIATAPTVPAGYTTLYVLTAGSGLSIKQTSATASFNVSTGAAVTTYRIHTLVYDPTTLDLGALPTNATGFDVNDLLIQGGGSICGALDVTGAVISVETCTADAGTLTANESSVFLAGGTATISASEATAPTVPAGYATEYVLTSGTGLVIEQLGAAASFNVTSSGAYTIHTLVYDPNTLDPAGLSPGATGFDVNALLIQGGGAICGALDVTGAAVTVEDCEADAGTLTADESSVFLAGGTATVSASEATAPTVPAGYTSLYVLTAGAGLVIEQSGATASFDVTSSGTYTIHTLVYDPNTLDPAGLSPGATGFDVNALLIQGGGAICGALDVAGAAITVEDCTADAGTLTADASSVFLAGGTATISASTATAPTVPAGYTTLYVLTSGAGLVIEQSGTTASFDVTSSGTYTIHTLVYDPNTLDPSALPAGATGFDVNALLIQGGGDICGALDVAGAAVTVEDCIADAGTLTANESSVFLAGGTATISASEATAPIVPAGYTTAYVLTSGTGLVIEQLGAAASFNVTSSGAYTIHTLVYDPNTLDPAGLSPGATGFDVNAVLIQGGGAICGALDVTGAAITVEDCEADAGTLTADASPVELVGGTATISASVATAPTVPAGYTSLYVLTAGAGLVIEQSGTTASFDVTSVGNYTIHTLVYDPNTLDPSTLPAGATGFDVNALLIQGGGDICGALDVTGAEIIVEDVLGINDLDKASFEYYPNPVQDALTLHAQNTIENVTMYNMLGQEVLRVTPNAIESIITMSELQTGFYFVKVTISNVTQTIRVLKK